MLKKECSSQGPIYKHTCARTNCC